MSDSEREGEEAPVVAADAARAQGRAVNLVIKNPYNPRAESVQVRLPVNDGSRVADIKNLLAAEYPGNPSPATQRLIYFGKMLADETPLSTVFARADVSETQTLHLLIPEEPKPAPSPAVQAPEQAAPSFGAALSADGQAGSAEGSNGPPTTNVGATNATAAPQAEAAARPAAVHWQQPGGAGGFPQGAPGRMGGAAALTPITASHAFLQQQLHYHQQLHEATLACLRASAGPFCDDETATAEDGGEARNLASEAASLPPLAPDASFAECAARLDVHYRHLVNTVEAAHRLQTTNAMLLQPWRFAQYSPLGLGPQPVPLAVLGQLGNDWNSASASGAAPVFRAENGGGAAPGDAAPPQPAVPAPAGAARRPARFVAINFHLLVKLALLVYLLTNDTSSPRFYGLIAFAAIVYMYEMGYFEPIIGTRETQRQLWMRLRLNELGHIATPAQVPRGLVADSYFFAKTFILSMIPSWTAVARADPQSDAEVAVPGNAAHPDEQHRAANEAPAHHDGDARPALAAGVPAAQ
mmetsp:Transcript_22237/g.63220  ORF Transcript_22237/g.63220 Transcript_22237/m.63220 type:complete len:526 (-) Transcript_22237:2069-3646(-)